MKFENPTYRAKLLKRYKRFLSDIDLGHTISVAHVPNTGSMESCLEEDLVLVSFHDDPKRKLQYTLEMTRSKDAWIFVNTSKTNALVFEALELKIIKELSMYSEILKEKPLFDSRIDFLLREKELPDAYVEVKNVTLKVGNKAMFPDAKTERGQKHLRDLIKAKEEGQRAVMLYVVNREDVESFSPATHIDPKYSSLLLEASKKGVEILAYQTKISEEEIILHKSIKVIL